MLHNTTSAARDNSSSGPGPGTGAATGPGMTGPSTNTASELKQTVSRTSAARSHTGSTARTPRWWKIRLFKGLIGDLRRRAPYYWSDWKDALDYRVVPATIYMYFANILPALAFSLDMFTRTHSQYGVNEVLLASVLGSVVFSVLACQPLVIVGVTGPITVFNYTVYDIMVPTGVNYLAFMCWIGLWALVMHWVLAITNSCNWLRYVTRFPCDIFGFYVAFIYLQKGVQVLTLLGDREPFYLSVLAAMLVFFIAYACGELGSSTLFHHHVRVFLKDYGTPLTVVFFTGFVHIGRMKQVSLESLPTSTAFFPTQDRGWLVHFWDIRVADVFLAIPFALLLTILFWFDHNVSSLIAQGTEFPLRKPPGFHWDIFLLGLTTGVAGILGIPFPNGLIPQAPFHTESLCVTKVVHSDSDNSNPNAADDDEGGDKKGHWELKRTHVVEQRVSNLAQGLLTLGTMTGPLLVVLHLIPQGVLAGLFFIMGYQALEGNGITAKILFLLRDKSLTSPASPLRRIRRRSRIWLFVALALVGFGATFAITQTVAAVGFPVFILALIPVRALLLPKIFTPQELGILDAPTASPFTMESVGGTYGGETPDVEDGGSPDETERPGVSSGGLFRGGEGDGRGSEGGIDRGKSEAELAELGQNTSMRRRSSAVARDAKDEGSIEMKNLGDEP
ncbi:nion exchange protein 4 [Diaporthe amygdali]|uniref:nion exchange protein 4 n=1 Tax=Phomopsis amygdali TaxID=1214568 RepID=UPI0022FE15A8|nr:nion exchange protein 4 [Diaporthe amygdali]KAJ0117126.1 nion exchange protein 4 [Diaporthe amygdali]